MSQFVPSLPPVPLAGELASLGAALIWSVSISLYTSFGRAVPASALNLYKNLIALAFMGIALAIVRPPLAADWRAYAILAGSGVLGLSLGDTALFAALKRLGAQVTSASQCLAPPIAALIAVLALDEALTPRELAGLLVTTSAVGALIYFGRRGGAHLANVPKTTLLAGLGFALVSAACQGGGLVLQRLGMQQVHVLPGTMVRIVPALLVLTAMTAASRQPLAPRRLFGTARQARFLVLAAFLGTFLGLLLMSFGAKYAKAGIAAALTSTYPIWIIPIARFALRERVSWQSAACTVVAVAGIVLMVA